METLNIYVGAQIEQMLATKVLEHSFVKHSSIPIRVSPLFHAISQRGLEIPPVSHEKIGNRTPFSFQRFAIPKLNNYKGRALYVDSDMLVFKDVAELNNWPFDGHDLLYCKVPAGSKRRPQFSVMLLNCEALKWDVSTIVADLNRGRWQYEELMYQMAVCPNPAQTLPAEWNCLEYFEAGKTALVHFTDMLEQPWLDVVSPLTELWTAALIDAIKSGFITKTFVEEEIHRGWVRPSLAYQIERNQPNPSQLPKVVVALDHCRFVSPPEHASILKSFTGYGESAPSLNQRMGRRFYATARTIIRRSVVSNVLKSVRNAIVRA